MDNPIYISREEFMDLDKMSEPYSIAHVNKDRSFYEDNQYIIRGKFYEIK